MKVAIFGSCVSRDLFENPVLRPTVGTYAARSSVISAAAAPLAIDEELVVLTSDWQRRCVLADFRKSFLSGLEEERPDWLILDLIDERFDLLCTPESCVTRSSAFVSAGLDEATDFGFVPLRRMSAECCALFDRAAEQFAARVTEVVPPERVVVHRALWSTRYRADGETSAFQGDRLELCMRQNAMLSAGYDTLERVFDGRALRVESDPEEHLADAAHRWGLEPYHYDDAYNAEAGGRLRDAFGLG